MNINELSSVKRNSKEHSHQRRTQSHHGTLIFFFSLIVKKKYDNKLFFLFSCCCFSVKDHPRSPNWTLDFEPAFSQRFCFLLSPRSIFPTAQRFPIRKHVTSGLGHVTSGDVTSGSDHVISGHFRFRSCDFRFRL